MKEFHVPYQLWNKIPSTTNRNVIGYWTLRGFLEKEEELMDKEVKKHKKSDPEYESDVWT